MRRATVLIGLVLAGTATVAAQAPPVHVADLIGLTLFGSDANNGASEDLHVMSPDGRRVAVVVQRGNLATNTVDYTLLVFATAAAGSAPHADTVVTLAAASNDAAISQVVWLADNQTVVFLGQRPGELPQVYTLDVATRVLTAHTHVAAGVASFQMAPSGDPIVYQEQGRADTSDYGTMRAHGFAVDPSVANANTPHTSGSTSR